MISIITFLADVFSQSDTAKTMAEITRIDPQFNKDSFLKECEFEIIPAVLEVRSCLSLTAFAVHRCFLLLFKYSIHSLMIELKPLPTIIVIAISVITKIMDNRERVYIYL